MSLGVTVLLSKAMIGHNSLDAKGWEVQKMPRGDSQLADATQPCTDDAARPARVVLLIRRSKGYWLNGSVDFTGILSTRLAMKSQVAIQRWNQLFKMQYSEFRMRLRSLAERTHLAGFDAILPWLDPEAVGRQPDGTWLVPVDEDDWLAPRIGHILRLTAPKVAGGLMTWDVVRKSADGAAKLNPNRFVESCGYAVRLPCSWASIQNHMTLGPAPHANATASSSHIREVLAVRNETPASLGLLFQHGAADVGRCLTRAIGSSAEGIPERLMPTWHQYQELMRELLASRTTHRHFHHLVRRGSTPKDGPQQP